MTVYQGMNWIRKDKRLALYARDGFACAYCERSLHTDYDREALKANFWRLTLDHIVPREAGGTNRADNLITSCYACNRAKADTYTAREFVRDAADYEALQAKRRAPFKRYRDIAKQVLADAADFSEAIDLMFMVTLEVAQ